ncbi:MAG: TonB-dependent receptor [Bacteroidota bacterium]
MRKYLTWFILIIISLACFFFSPAIAQAQEIQRQSREKYTVSGFVKEAENGESLIGTNVYIKELLKGTSTNKDGFYSLTLDKGNYTLIVKYLGFSDFSRQITLDKDTRLNIELKEAIITTDEIVITGERPDRNVQSTVMSTFELPVEEIKVLPAFMGEVDILKTIQLLPGVQSAGEGNSGFYIRGGGPDQNLILLDEAVVYNAAHLFGFFSVFNADAVKNVNLIKGGMPANYGGRLSSVLDISMKEGNSKKYQADCGIGLISSRLTIQGPIKKDTCSFIVSGRRTYIDVVMKPFIKESSPFKKTGYYFYDLTAKVNYKISDKDRVFLSGYFGNDVFNVDFSGFGAKILWGNATTSLRWNHLFNNKLFLKTTAIYSKYNFSFGAEQNQFEFELFSGITDWNAKVDFNYLPTIRHNIKFGANYIFHTFVPSSVSARSGDVVFDTGEITKLYAHEGALYLTDDFDLSDMFKINAGLRYSCFQQIGPFDRYRRDEYGKILDTISYEAGENVKTYHHIEPRISLRYSLDQRSSVKASYTQNYQYVHLATLSAVSLPTDIWIPSTSLVEPKFSTQYAVGYFRNFMDDKYETSVELYYKEMENMIEYKEGYSPDNDINDNPDNNFVFGEGKSYGAEFFVKKRTGKTTGWIGYTLSWTKRQFPDINNGVEYFAKYDRRHDLSLIITHELNPKWTFSTVFIYASGNAITLPVSRYVIEGIVVSEFGERNSFRMDPYHRLDISVTYSSGKHKKFDSSWNFSVYNVYNRYNPYFIYFDTSGNYEEGTLEIQAKQVSLFPILPSITWNFRF